VLTTNQTKHKTHDKQMARRYKSNRGDRNPGTAYVEQVNHL